MSELTAILRAQIEANGSLSVADYMEAALAHPEYGYYRTHRIFGSGGDFTTAPEISQVFGELIGAYVVGEWNRLGSPPLSLVELGPGRGTLMQDLLRATRRVQGFHESITIHMVEISASLAHEQYQLLRHSHPRIEWLDHLDQVPETNPIILVANEFFDALPIRQHVKTTAGICERRVVWDEVAGSFAFELAPPGLQLAKSDKIIAENTVIESSPASRETMRRIARRLRAKGGTALIIDYGYLGDAHHDTLQAVKAHQFHSVLKDPGEADITAHVDFTSLMAIAEEENMATASLMTQGQFLAHLGVELRLGALLAQAEPHQKEGIISSVTRLISPQAMGELFKVMQVRA
jgi:NADH dehydrogenase [ubiquinone] 1 alpha subcomplex assembly factor 7